MMENVKEQYNVQEYSAAQTSLEQIFNIFARAAKETKHRAVDVSKKQN